MRRWKTIARAPHREKLVAKLFSILLAFVACELALAASAPTGPLPDTVKPLAYRLTFEIDPAQSTFAGRAEIDVDLSVPTRSIFLHGHGLRVSKASIKTQDSETPASYAQVDDTGVARVDAQGDLPSGACTLIFEYEADIHDGAQGLFRANVAGDWYAWTQMAPIDARRMFPSFDEPRFKTPFAVSVRAPNGLKVFANAPEASSRAAGGSTVHEFQRTLPLPTYLFAVAVGPFETLATTIPKNAIRPDPLSFRVIATKGQTARMRMALTHAPALLTALEEYFQIPYPYEKLDFIGTPILGGAMENAGLVVYDDSIILLDENAPFAQLRAFAEIVAHELAHQWFGNLVTPAWWTDVWLSESFAEWLGKYVAHRWRPELGIDSARLQEAFAAMAIDALPNGRPVRQAITENRQVASAFDAITYQKGAQVLAMFEAYVGSEVFRQALRTHLARFRHGIATSEDFFRTVSDTAKSPRLVAALQSFVDQPGVPLVDLQWTNGKPKVNQRTYRPVGVDAKSETQWLIPVCASHRSKKHCTLLEDRATELDIPGKPTAVMPNAEGAGYYRFRLDDEGWSRLIAASNSLSGPEALALADSIFADFTAGGGKFVNVLYAAKALSAHSDRLAVLELGSRLRELASTALPREHVDDYRRFMHSIYAPRLRALGFDPRPGAHAHESPQRQALRQSLVPLVALEGRDPAVRRKLARAAVAYVEGRTEVLDHAFRAEAFTVAVQDRGVPFMRALRDTLVRSTEPLLREQAVNALARADTPELARAALEMSLSEGVLSLETAIILLSMSRERDARSEVIDFVDRNFERVMKAVPGFLRPQFALLFARGCERTDIERAENFIRPRLTELGGGELELEQAKQRIQACIALREMKAEEMAAALAKAR